LSIPVIASINGITPGGWVRYAKHLADAGAHAIELNLYDVVVDPQVSAADVERRYVELVEEVKSEIDVPLAVKLSPWFTALGNLAMQLQSAGADGLVLFNRLYQPDIDLDSLAVVPKLTLSTSAESRLPLHWVAAGRELWRARRCRRGEAVAGGRRRGDDHEFVAPSWSRTSPCDRALRARVDGGAGVRQRQ
jgi:dihydroorotate dehydrogenase